MHEDNRTIDPDLAAAYAHRLASETPSGRYVAGYGSVGEPGVELAIHRGARRFVPIHDLGTGFVAAYAHIEVAPRLIDALNNKE